MFKKLSHVGIVVKNLDEAIKRYNDIFHHNTFEHCYM